MLGRTHGDLFFQEKLLLNGIGMRIRLIRLKDEFLLMIGDGKARFKARVMEAMMLVRKVRIMSAVTLAHAKALEKSKAKFSIKQVAYKAFSISRGNLDVSPKNAFFGKF